MGKRLWSSLKVKRSLMADTGKFQLWPHRKPILATARGIKSSIQGGLSLKVDQRPSSVLTSCTIRHPKDTRLFYQTNKGFPGFQNRTKRRFSGELFCSGGNMTIKELQKKCVRDIKSQKSKLRMNTVRFQKNKGIYLCMVISFIYSYKRKSQRENIWWDSQRIYGTIISLKLQITNVCFS